MDRRGADNRDRGANQTLLNTPSVDAIDEFKVQRSDYSAEFGRTGAGSSACSRGPAPASFTETRTYEFVRNNAFAANNFLNNANGLILVATGRPRYRPCAITTSAGRWAELS
jgi:hypothetical protein